MAKKIYIIGGSPCCGKSTIAERISADYGAYYFKVDDYLDEFIKLAAAKGLPVCSKVRYMSADAIWMRKPSEQCTEEFLIYNEISESVFKKLESIEADVIVAEGAAFTPDVMKDAGERGYICMVPTPDFQISHYKMREWIKYILKDCADKETAFDNWMQRDVLFAGQVKAECEAMGVPCIVVDGTQPVDEVYESVKQKLGLDH